MHINHVSHCCQASIETGIEREYPLGGRTWGINYIVEICGECHQECDSVDECGTCGELLQNGKCINPICEESAVAV